MRHQPGIVEHDVDTAMTLQGQIDQRLYLLGLGHVGGLDLDLGARGPQIACQCLQAFKPASAQHQMRAVLGQHTRGSLTQAAAGPCNDYDLVLDGVAHGKALLKAVESHQTSYLPQGASANKAVIR